MSVCGGSHVVVVVAAAAAAVHGDPSMAVGLPKTVYVSAGQAE